MAAVVEAVAPRSTMQQQFQQATTDVEVDYSAAAPKEVPRVVVRTPQIHWHGKSPVFAVDFHPHFSRLCATGGLEPDGTGGVHLWIVNDGVGENPDKAPVTFVQDLQGHEKAINCLRFCPKGDLLASAGVEGSVVIWRRTGVAVNPAAAVAGHEKWEYMTMLRAQTLDVVDLSWSPTCTQLATASVDNTAAVFNLTPNKDKVAANIRGHDHFALGVAWDPKEEYILTVSSDGSCRFHTSKSRKWKADARTAHIACRMEFLNKKGAASTGAAEGEVNKKEFKMFLDDSMAAHRRRAAWSPDGLFAVVPAGQYQASPASAPYYVSHVIARRNPTKSFALLPSGRKPSVAVKFCPTLYQLSRNVTKEVISEGVPTPEKLFATPQKAAQDQDTQSGFNMPYKMIFAVATSNSILIYDTEQMKTPIMYVSGIHFDTLTDIAWSKDGQYLIATSKDGYCSMIEFAAGELGEPLDPDMLPPVVAKNSMPGKSIDLSIKDPDDEVAETVPTEETAAQKIAEMVAEPTPLPELMEFKEGDRVSARWKGGAWFSGTITKVNEPVAPEAKASKDGEEDATTLEMLVESQEPAKTYAVQFDDGDFDDSVPRDHIKQWEEKRARKRRIVPQVVKSVDELPVTDHAVQTNSEAGSSAKDAVRVEMDLVQVDGGAAVETPQKEPVAQERTEAVGCGESTGAHDAAAVPTPVESETPSQAASEAAPKKRRIIPTTVAPGP